MKKQTYNIPKNKAKCKDCWTPHSEREREGVNLGVLGSTQVSICAVPTVARNEIQAETSKLNCISTPRGWGANQITSVS